MKNTFFIIYITAKLKTMKQQWMTLVWGVMVLLFSSCGDTKIKHDSKNELRPPAYPLVTIDPYTSGWAFSDCLYDAPVKHWTGKDFPLIGVAKVDGQVYRFMGAEDAEFTTLAGTSEQSLWSGKYTTRKPADGWQNPGFNDHSWKEGEAAFGTMDSEPTARTQWGEEHIWVRRIIHITDDLQGRKVYLDYSHDDDAVIYINGIKVVDTGYAWKKHVVTKLPEEVVATLKPGENLIAASCRNRAHGGLLDFGLAVEKEGQRSFVQIARQLSVEIQPMQTLYKFACGPVNLDLTFTAPLFMDDLELMARPVNYISYTVASTDGQKHAVELYFEASPQWAVDLAGQPSTAESFVDENLVFLKTGSRDQKVLAKKGDDVRIDWGYFYLAADKENTQYATGSSRELRKSFVEGKLSATGTDGYDRLALVRSLGETKVSEGHLLIGYDDIYSVQYFGENLRPYWNRSGNETIVSQFHKAEREYDVLMTKAIAFDNQLMREATEAGGPQVCGTLCIGPSTGYCCP